MVQPAEAVQGEEDVARRGHGREDAAHLVRVALCQPDVLAHHRVLVPQVLEVGAVYVAVEDLDGQGEDDHQEPQEEADPLPSQPGRQRLQRQRREDGEGGHEVGVEEAVEGVRLVRVDYWCCPARDGGYVD